MDHSGLFLMSARNWGRLTGFVIGCFLLVPIMTRTCTQHLDKPSAYHAKRLVYPFSIVPGGVDSAQQAGLSNGKALRLKADLWAYVNYRRDGHVFWTTKLVRIPAGELVFSDGARMVRARCGNSISLRPQVPTEPSDVSELLDVPQSETDTHELTVLPYPTKIIETDPSVTVNPQETHNLMPPVSPVYSPSYGYAPPAKTVPMPEGSFGGMMLALAGFLSIWWLLCHFVVRTK